MDNHPTFYPRTNKQTNKSDFSKKYHETVFLFKILLKSGFHSIAHVYANLTLIMEKAIQGVPHLHENH